MDGTATDGSTAPPADPANRTYGGFRLDANSRLLVGSDGRTRRLRARSLAVFQELAAHPGRLLDKQALFATVWRGRHVGDDSLVQCITEIRRALGDAEKRIVVTVPRQGYRLVPDDGGHTKVESGWSGGAALPGEVATGTAPPLIGRAPECRELVSALASAVHDENRLVLIQGEAGIGKTRLVEELARMAIGRGAVVAHAMAYEIGSGMAYASLVSWLRQPEIGRGLAALDPLWKHEVARILPELQLVALPSPTTPDGWCKPRFLEALYRAVTDRERPTVLVLDNLQWCDGETLEWLHYAVTRRPGSGLTVAVTRRSEAALQSTAERLLANLAHGGLSRTIRLAPLGKRATTELAAAVRGEPLDDDECTAVFAATGGNPLFVIETVRTAPLPDGEARTIPGRVREAIAAKLEGLAPEELEALHYAAAYARPFAPSLLADASGRDVDAIERALDTLWRRGLLVGRGTRCELRHDLIREVAYAEIGLVTRTRLHKALARAIDAALADGERDRASAELAEQYARAESWEEALRHHREAASQARERYAADSEAKALRGALQAASELPDTLENRRVEIELSLELGLAESAVRGWGNDRVGRAWSRAHELARRSGTLEQRARALNALDTYHRDRGQWRRCRPLSDEAEALLPRIEDRYLRLCLRSARAALVLHDGDPVSSLELYEGILESAGEIVEPTFRWFNTTFTIGAHFRSAQCLWLLGEIDRAHEHAERAMLLSETASDPFHRAITLFHVALLYEYGRDSTRVRSIAEELADVAEHHGFGFYRGSAALFRAWASLREGGDGADLRCMREHTECQHSAGTRMFEPYWRSNLAEALLLLGRADEALQEARSALEIAERTGNRYWNANLLRVIADGLHASGESPRRVSAVYREAVETARAQGATTLALRASVAAARALGSPSDIERLAAVHSRFDQGHGSRDLREARTLLEGRASRV